MKKYILLLTLISGFILTAAPVPSYVVVGENPSPLEKMALEDLQFFWKKLYGAELSVITENASADKSVIYLGKTAFADQVSSGDFGKEEWQIKTVGDDLLITGGRPAGTLYGVYAVLEALGVRFYTWEYTHIPGKPKEFPIFDERKSPAFGGRMIATRFSAELFESGAAPEVKDAWNKWLLRNRSNAQEYVHLDVFYKGDMHNITHRPQFHSLNCYVPFKLFDEHPEYFSMDSSGNRFKPFNYESGGSLCMSNPEVIRVVTESLRKMIVKDRKVLPRENWPVMYDISVLDATTFICLCPDCKAITAEEGSETGLIIRFLNAISREIIKEYPEIQLRTMAYGPTNQPVFKTRPMDNIQFQVTDLFSTSDPFRPLSDPVNAEKKLYLDRWAKVVKNLAVWDYGNIYFYFKPPRVETTFNALADDLRYFKSINVNSILFEWEKSHIAPQNFIDLGYYILFRLMIDPQIDAEKAAQEFITDYYGPCAGVVSKYFHLIRDGVKSSPRSQTTITASTWEFMTPEFAVQMYIDMRVAAVKLPENNIFRIRLEREMIPLMWEVLAKRYVYEKAFAAENVSMASLLEECRSYVRRYMVRYPAKKRTFCEKIFAVDFAEIANPVNIPAEFRHIPEKELRIFTAKNASGVNPGLGASRVDDPDTVSGQAVRSANVDPAYHGVAVRQPGKHRFITTRFVWENFKKGSISTILKEVPQDEKYHWFAIPGTMTIGPQSYFWGHGWAISVATSNMYMLTGDIEKDNTWRCFFRVKFTGPAYVKNSTAANAIYFDCVVFTRPQYNIKQPVAQQ